MPSSADQAGGQGCQKIEKAWRGRCLPNNGEPFTSIMKRFTETSKWTDGWFSELSGAHMLAWQYLCDCCDPAGVIDPPGRVASAMLPLDVDWKEFLKVAGHRIVTLPNGKWFLPTFAAFQYPAGLNNACKAHSKVIESVIKNDLPIEVKGIERAFQTHSKPNGSLIEGSHEEDKEKEEETEAVEDTEEEPHPGKPGGESLEELENQNEGQKASSSDRDLLGNNSQRSAGRCETDPPRSPYVETEGGEDTPKPKAQLDAEFLEDLWKSAPRLSRSRSSKKQVETAWKATKPKPDLAETLATMKRWAECEEWTKDGGQFAPALHRAIKDRKWESEPEKPINGANGAAMNLNRKLKTNPRVVRDGVVIER